MSNRKLDLTSIEHALRVAEHLSFRRAAEAIGISQSSISKRVARLEDRIGVALFERSHSGVRVTDAGRRFFQHVILALSELDEASEVAGKIGRVESGHLSIGIISSLAAGFLRELIEMFSDQHPDVKLTIEDCSIGNCISLLREKVFDLIFTIDDVAANDCECQRLWSEQIFFALPQGHRLCEAEAIDWADLRYETMILNQSASWRTRYDSDLRKWAALGEQLDIQRFAVGRDTLMHMVALGWGISLTSEAAVAVIFPGVVFRPMAGEDNFLHFSAVWLSQNNNQALRRMIAIARVLSQKQSPWDRR